MVTPTHIRAGFINAAFVVFQERAGGTVEIPFGQECFTAPLFAVCLDELNLDFRESMVASFRTDHSALRANRMLRFDHYFVTLQAVMDGLGFGIGPFPTLAIECSNGRLAQPFPSLCVPGSKYHAMVPLDADKPAHLRAFLDWLQSVCPEP